MKYKPQEPKKIGVRELARNLSTYLENAVYQPVIVTNHGEELALISFPKKKNSKEIKKKNISDLAFFKNFQEPADWKGMSSVQISDELREESWSR